MSGINPTSPPQQPNFTTQDATTYKGALDASINAQARVGWLFAPHAQDTPNMTVRLEAGAILSGVTLTEVAAQNTATITAPSTHPRIDRVVIDRSTGAVSVVEGDEAASPEPPAIPSGKLPVAQVLLATDTTAITNADITDERVGGGSVAIGSIASPSETEVASTQDVADAIAAIPTADAEARALAMFNGFIAQIAAARASGPIPSGYMHLFATDELATKTDATYDGSGKRYGNAGSQSQVAQGTGSIITNFANLTSAAWDGNTSQAITSCSYNGSSGVRYTGKDWGVGQSKVISGFKAWGSNDQGYCDTGTGTVTHTLYGSNSSPASPTDGTALGSVTAANSSSSPQVQNLAIASTTAYRYHWLTQSGAQSSNCCYCEVQFFETSASTNMTLIPTAITAGAAPNTVDVFLLHKAVDAVTLNTDIKVRVSRDNGSNWSGYVTLAEVCQYDADYKLLKGTADLSALASGTSVKWELTTLNTKGQYVRAVAMLLN
jgi:hypothetical protein